MSFLGAESAKPQMLLFSATVPYWVQEVADKYMSRDRVVVDLIGGEDLKTSVGVEHKAICCPYTERPSTIADVLQVGLIVNFNDRGMLSSPQLTSIDQNCLFICLFVHNHYVDITFICISVAGVQWSAWSDDDLYQDEAGCK